MKEFEYIHEDGGETLFPSLQKIETKNQDNLLTQAYMLVFFSVLKFNV